MPPHQPPARTTAITGHKQFADPERVMSMPRQRRHEAAASIRLGYDRLSLSSGLSTSKLTGGARSPGYMY